MLAECGVCIAHVPSTGLEPAVEHGITGRGCTNGSQLLCELGIGIYIASQLIQQRPLIILESYAYAVVSC